MSFKPRGIRLRKKTSRPSQKGLMELHVPHNSLQAAETHRTEEHLGKKTLPWAPSLEFWSIVPESPPPAWPGARHRWQRSSGLQPTPGILQTTTTTNKFCPVCWHHQQWAGANVRKAESPATPSFLFSVPSRWNLDSSFASITQVNPDSTGSQKAWFLIAIKLGISH